MPRHRRSPTIDRARPYGRGMNAPPGPQSPRSKRLRRWAVGLAVLSGAAFIASIAFAGVLPDAPALVYPALHFVGLATALAGYLLWQRSDPAYDFSHEPAADE